MKTNDLLLLAVGGAAAAYFLFYTDEGKDIVSEISDATGIEVPDIDIEKHYKGKSGGRKSGTVDDIYMPIQDLHIPENYYKFRYIIDEARLPSENFWDWYQKGSGLKYEDYYYPPHHYYNPDYYVFNGNWYKRWYPNIYDISYKPRKRIPYWFGEVYY